MAYTKKAGSEIAEITESIAVLSESPRSDWTTELCKISWNGKEAKLEIRKMNKHAEDGIKFGKGVGLTDEEANILVEELVNLGYGDTKKLRVAIKNRTNS